MAILVSVDRGKAERHCLIDVKEAIAPAAPRSKSGNMPRDSAGRVVAGASNLSAEQCAGAFLDVQGRTPESRRPVHGHPRSPPAGGGPAMLRALPPQRLRPPARKADDDCLQELRWLYDRRSVEETRRDLAAWIAKWGDRYQKLVDWVEETIEETFTFYRLPRQHHKHLKSTNISNASTMKSNAEPCRPHLPQCPGLSASHPSLSRRNTRKLARIPPLPQYERSQRAQEDQPPPSRLTQRFFGAAHKNLSQSNIKMGEGEISIQLQRMFAFGDALRRALGEYLDMS